MAAAGVADGGLARVHSRTYRLACDWKVYADNFLVPRSPRKPVGRPARA